MAKRERWFNVLLVISEWTADLETWRIDRSSHARVTEVKALSIEYTLPPEARARVPRDSDNRSNSRNVPCPTNHALNYYQKMFVEIFQKRFLLDEKMFFRKNIFITQNLPRNPKIILRSPKNQVKRSKTQNVQKVLSPGLSRNQVSA